MEVASIIILGVVVVISFLLNFISFDIGNKGRPIAKEQGFSHVALCYGNGILGQ